MKFIKTALLTSAYLLLAASVVRACMLYIKNDSGRPVLLKSVSKKYRAKKILPANSQPVDFGRSDERADFELWVPAKKNSKRFTAPKGRFKQIGCSTSHKIPLNVSDLEDPDFDHELFERENVASAQEMEAQDLIDDQAMGG